MGKVSNRSSLVSPRRRILKSCPGVGVKKNRGPAKVSLSAPPPVQSFVDEDSGFGGDQSLDSESSHISASGNISSGGPSLTSILPSLAMVPQTKLLLVSLLQGAGGEQGTGTSQKRPGKIAVGALTPTAQLTISNGTSQTGNTHGAVTSSGAEKEWLLTPKSVGPLVAGASSFSLQGAMCTEVVSEQPSDGISSPPNYSTGTVPDGNTSQKGVENHVNLPGNRLPADFCGEEAQELPGNLGSKNSRHVPPLISFRDVSLLSTLGTIKNTSAPVVEGNAQVCRNKKVLRQNVQSNSPVPLTAQLSPRSSDGSVELVLVSQPEEQHRARYQTEGSRGAVKDRDGTGHPTVKLIGYWKPTVIQVFVGEDSARTTPHMFYQVCRVCGKNSTPCKEKRIDGTAVIEATLDPDSEMSLSCDCVGILKERNVDVEHRFKAIVSRGRKKSTKCCLVFRTFITLPNGTQETLQVVSKPIACTQPPGVPEILRKSLSSCLASGGEEIFIFGKNFAKDTVVIFQETGAKSQPIWEETAIPEKETLQPIHLIVSVPKYYDETITQEVSVQMVVSSGNKLSEPHSFTYMPIVSKKEPQGIEIPEERKLPKGVSPGALQVNRHYAETRTLPSAVQESVGSVRTSNAELKMASVPVTKPVVSSVRVPRVVRSSISSKKAFGCTSHSASQLYKTPLVAKKTMAPPTGTSRVKVSSAVTGANVNMTEIKKENSEELRQNNEEKQDLSKKTVSLGSLVELLNAVQSLPSGSIEEFVKLVKDNAKGTESAKFQTIQDSSNSVQESKVTNMSPSIMPQCKVQAQPIQTNLLIPRDISSSRVIPAVTTNLGLWPLTLFPSITTSQSIAGGPKVARVAPIAPTTVVSSPGPARTVRVCVTEAPHISLEPPKKKACDRADDIEYELMDRTQLVGETVVNNVMSAPIVSQNPVATYRTERQPTPGNIVMNQGEAPNPTAATCAPEHAFIHPAPQTASVTRPSPFASSVGNSINVSKQQLLYQNITQSMLQNMNQAPQPLNQPMNVNVTLHQPVELNQQLAVSLGQNLQGVSQPMTVSVNHSSQEINQPITVSQGVDQPMTVSLNHASEGVSQAMNMPLNHASQVVSQPMTLSLSHSSQGVSQSLNVSSLSHSHPSQDVNQNIPVSLNQNLHQGSHPLNVSCLPSASDVNPVRQAEQQSISQHTSPQDINVSPIVSTTVSGPLFNQPTGIVTPQMVVAPHAAIPSCIGNQVPTLCSQTGDSSALTHSDPLLSQSVTSMHLDQSDTVAQRSHSSESRPRTDGLMTSSTTTAQVSMQNEVTSAINLSETELLNYFDPNCFDNV